jgi:succinyl-diaminopimelate desuccinylase
LAELGFEVHRMVSGHAPDGPVENLFATRGSGGPHFAFAGHVDVVPPGDGWTGDPFEPAIRGGLLYGRGAVDMKGAIAAFVAACADVPDHGGTLSLIITGDEEGPAIHGTQALMVWMEERGIRPDMILIGEPTSEARLGDVVKIGRRGTVNMWLTVPGVQGHVAYPHRTDNPVPKLAEGDRRARCASSRRRHRCLPAVQPRVHRGVDAHPGDQHRARFRDRSAQHPLQQSPSRRGSGDAGAGNRRAGGAGDDRGSQDLGRSFPQSGRAAVRHPDDSDREETGITPTLSTSGGTSDGRFLIKIAPVVDFGLPNATMHKLDEAAAVADLVALQAIYARVIRAALS